jgi:hypothetical protein
MHVAGGIMPKQIHLPTGRVTMESVLRLLLIDLRVASVKGHATDYEKILAKAEGDFVGHRSWHAWSAGAARSKAPGQP